MGAWRRYLTEHEPYLAVSMRQSGWGPGNLHRGVTNAIKIPKTRQMRNKGVRRLIDSDVGIGIDTVNARQERACMEWG